MTSLPLTGDLKNLTLRLADIPKEISADHIYKQIKLITDKITELTTTKSKLELERRSALSGVVDQNKLLFRVRRAINNLEKAPTENRRPIFSNLIKFVAPIPQK